MNRICAELCITRQGYHKGLKRKETKDHEEEKILELVHTQRREMPMLGCKKLKYLLQPDLDRLEIKIGRDKFFNLMERKGLLIRRKKRYAVTTNSLHRFRVHDNKIKEITATRSNEILVSDITYIKLRESFNYLSIVTDLYSRKIVGYDLSDSLNIEGSVRALKMSIRGKKDLSETIHHSDRGIQYCSNIYTGLLTKNGIRISMSEKGNPYENAVAERINGILKQEFMLGETFKTQEQAEKSVKEAIEIYNEKRPHMSLNYMTPNEKYAS